MVKSREEIFKMRKKYTEGTRVEVILMNDPRGVL